MSHLHSLSNLKDNCEATGNCGEYNTVLRQEESSADANTAAANQASITWGILIALIGLAVLITPFVKPLQRFLRFSLPKLAIVAPIIIGLLVGAFIGFAISFSACFKQECSQAESSAVLTIPAASLIISIPLAMRLYRKRQGMAESIIRPNPKVWIIIGLLIIAFAIIRTISAISDNNRDNVSNKAYLRNLEL